mmetsp:Transcript_30219/g.66477  ORF Transcript_30219/g.66477 Transcript_30219/m.66477 type:complete len:249 (-) Transcript_30219:1157-1903(-)
MTSPCILFSEFFRPKANVRNTQLQHVCVLDFCSCEGIAAKLIRLCLELWITIVKGLLRGLLRVEVPIDALLVSTNFTCLAFMRTVATRSLSMLPIVTATPALAIALNSEPLVVDTSHGALLIIHVDVFLDRQVAVTSVLDVAANWGVVLHNEEVFLGLTWSAKPLTDLLSRIIRRIMVAITTMAINATWQVVHRNENIDVARMPVDCHSHPKRQHDLDSLDGWMSAASPHYLGPVVVLDIYKVRHLES